MTLTLMGKKRGMMQVFDEKGNAIVCTVIQVEPNVVTQVKTKESDGYDAIQLSFEKIKGKTEQTIAKRAGKPQLGHFKKANVEPRRFLVESRLDPASYTVGQEIGVDAFNEIHLVDATAISKGKGYQGVIKRHNFAGGPASHGSSFHRHAGSTGHRSTPGRGLPGGRKAGHLGCEQVTVQSLEVVKIDAENQVILVKGQVPGPRGGLVYIKKAVKRQKKIHK